MLGKDDDNFVKAASPLLRPVHQETDHYAQSKPTEEQKQLNAEPSPSEVSNEFAKSFSFYNIPENENLRIVE